MYDLASLRPSIPVGEPWLSGQEEQKQLLGTRAPALIKPGTPADRITSMFVPAPVICLWR